MNIGKLQKNFQRDPPIILENDDKLNFENMAVVMVVEMDEESA